MDTRININRLSRELYRRGTHRLLGNPFLGSFTAFLAVLFLVRIAANFYLAINLWNKGSNIDAVQIASAHFVFLSAYVIWVGSLASFRIGCSLPALCFVNFTPHGKHFRSGFIRQTAFLRPMNIASVSIILFMTIVFSMVCGGWQAVVVRALVVLSFIFIGIVIVIAVASWALPSQSEIRMLEMLYLLFLVLLNPDIGSSNNRISILFRGCHYFSPIVWNVGFTVGLIVMLSILVLLLVRVLSAMGNLFRRQLSFRPMESWYLRFLRIRYWVVLYMITIPVFVSSVISPSTKWWTLLLSILFGVASYLYFIAQCENTLYEKWRCSLSDKGSIRFIAGSVWIHIVLMTIPVLGYIVTK